jgi:hypothetical protein
MKRIILCLTVALSHVLISGKSTMGCNRSDQSCTKYHQCGTGNNNGSNMISNVQ